MVSVAHTHSFNRHFPGKPGLTSCPLVCVCCIKTPLAIMCCHRKQTAHQTYRSADQQLLDNRGNWTDRQTYRHKQTDREKLDSIRVDGCHIDFFVADDLQNTSIYFRHCTEYSAQIISQTVYSYLAE